MNKGDTVRLAAACTLTTDRGVKRSYPAGTAFDVVGYTNDGTGGVLFRGAHASGLRVLLRPDQVVQADPDDDDAAGVDLGDPVALGA